MNKDIEMTEEDWYVANKMEAYLTSRFSFLQNQRSDIDRDIADEMRVYNNVDTKINVMPENFIKTKVPFIYSQVQTIVSRLIRSFFEGDNYLKVFMEKKEFEDIQEDVTHWAQEEMDKIGLKYKARDYLEQSLVSRVAWLVLRPTKVELSIDAGKKVPGYRLQFDVHPYREVWFDTKAKDVHSTDFFIKKVVPLASIHGNPNEYFNLDQVRPVGTDPRSDDSLETKSANLSNVDYSSKNYSAGSSSENGPGFSTSDSDGTQITGNTLIEVYEYYGPYDFSPLSPGEYGYVPDIKEVLCTLVNGRTLVRWQEVDLGLNRKRLIFPIRPIAQAGSLIGKSIPQITKDQSEQLNLAETLRMTNFKNLTGLLFKYNKNADIDIEELFNGSGNAIGWDETPDDVQIFNQPNLIAESNAMIADIKQDIQITTGGVDAVVGGSKIPDSYAGQQSMTQQALFKFQMMSENVAQDLRDFVNYSLIILIKYNKEHIALRWPKIIPFLDQSIDELENNYSFDILLRDAAIRRDVEQAQWANMVGIVGPLVQQAGGNIPELVRQLLIKFGMSSPERVLSPETPDQILNKLLNNPQMAAQVMQALSQNAAQQVKGNGGTPAPVQTEAAINAQLTQGA